MPVSSAPWTPRPGQSSASPKLRALAPNTAVPTGQWKVFLSSGAPTTVSNAPQGNSRSEADAPGARARRASAPRRQPASNANPNFNPQAGADGGENAGKSDEILISARIESGWAQTSRGALLVVGGNDGGVRALDARSGRVVWSQSVGRAPLALLSGPPARDDPARAPTVVAVTPTGVWRWKAVDGTPLSHSVWGADFGHATAAAVSGPRLFVAGRDVAVFDFAAAP
jgi:outer membrane protein assembly factor BamB